MQLWHMHSKVLKGFYQSDVFAAGASRNDAIQVALGAFDHWSAKQVKENFYHPLVSDLEPDDEDFKGRLRTVRTAFHEELQKSLEPVPGRAKICVHS